MNLLAAAAEDREAGPIGLVLILCLLVALVFLIRSMNKHLRKVPDGFARREAGPGPTPRTGAVAEPAAPAAAGTDPAPGDGPSIDPTPGSED